MTTPDQTPHIGMELGYARVSTTKQHLDRQIDAILKVGVPMERLYVDKRTGSNVDREGLKKLISYVRPGDTIVVYTLDRLGRNLREVLNVAHDLEQRGVGVRSLADPLPIDTRSTGMGRIAFMLLALFAEMERVFTAERAAHARAVAQAQGRNIGRPMAHSAAQREHAQLLRDRGESLTQIAAKTGIPKSSLRRYLTVDQPTTAPR